MDPGNPLRLDSPLARPREVLAKLEQRARRRFGQHFLTDVSVVERIVRGARVATGERVVEVGPGLGILTEALLAAGAELTTVELDRDLAEHIRLTFPAVRVIEADALKVEWETLNEGPSEEGAGEASKPTEPLKLVSNLPYNIGTPLVMQLVRKPGLFRSLTVMLQLEVVQRLCAEPGSKTYGALSVELQARARPTFLLKVPPDRFHPRPKVDSAVVRLETFPEPQVGTVSPGFFDAVVRAAFAQRRKTVLNALSARFGRDRSKLALERAEISPELRAEQLDLESFRRLAAALDALGNDQR